MKTINYQPLSSSVSFADTRAYFKSTGKSSYIGLIVFVAIFGVVAIFGPVPLVINALVTRDAGSFVGAMVFLGILLAFIWLIAWSVFVTSRGIIRLQRFAHVNGFQFYSNVKDPSYAGMIFNHGHSKVLTSSLVSEGDHGKAVEFGNYQYVIGSGKNRQTVNFGFVRIQLTRALPHLVLDAKSNNIFKRFTNLPSTFDTSQRLELEGDFNNYFSLYAPKAYERDALYVMTPDVMAALIDGAKAYDLEIVDNQLFIYSSMPFLLHMQGDLEKLFAMTNTIAKELDEQTDYYADERIGDRSVNVVADPGRRLKKGINWIVVAVIIYVVINFIMQFVGVGSSLFFRD